MLLVELPAAAGGLFLVLRLPLASDIFALYVLGRYSLVWAACQLCATLTKETVSKARLIFARAAADPSALPFYHWRGTTPLLLGM